MVYFFKTVQNNLFPPDDNLESDWLVFDFEDPLWVDELLSRLTPDCVYLISCLHVLAVFFFERGYSPLLCTY